MKKIYSMLFAAAAISFGAASCSDFLDEDNQTGETADLAYNTVSGIDGLIQSAYTYTHGWWGKEPSLGLAEMGSDLFYFGYDNKQKSMLKYDISAEALGKLNVNVANECAEFVAKASLNGSQLVVEMRKVYKNDHEPVSNWNKIVEVVDVAKNYQNMQVVLSK